MAALTVVGALGLQRVQKEGKSAGIEPETGLFNAGIEPETGLFNAGIEPETGLFNAGIEPETGLFNARMSHLFSRSNLSVSGLRPGDRDERPLQRASLGDGWCEWDAYAARRLHIPRAARTPRRGGQALVHAKY